MIWEVTWRRFAVLVRGLSADSLWQLALRASARGRPAFAGQAVNRITDPGAIKSWFRSLATVDGRSN